MTTTLEKKGLIVRIKSEEDGRSYRFQLTDEGMKIYKGHEDMHKTLYDELRKELENYTEEDLAKTKRILDIISRSMDSYKTFK